MKTMSNDSCKSVQHLIVDVLFDDLAEGDREHLDAHLSTCDACRLLLKEMRGTLQLTRQVPESMPSEAYWPAFKSRLNKRLAHQTNSRPTPAQGISFLSWIQQTLLPAPAWTYQLAMALLLVVSGIFIGRYGWDQDTQPIAEHDEAVAAEDPYGTPAKLASQTQRYLDRSNVLLLGLVNVDPQSDEAIVLNLERKQEIASDLLDEAAPIMAALNANNEEQLRRLIEDLELILRQIANLEIQEDVPGIELIQQGVEHRSLLLKINLESMKLMDQPSAAGPLESSPFENSPPAVDLES